MLGRRIATLMLVVALFFPVVSISSIGVVSAEPNVLNVPNDYPTIESAVNAANDGDTILVSAGRYYENVLVNKSVSIIGESPETTKVHGINYEEDVFYITADNVVIANMTINPTSSRSGILLSFADNCTVSNNLFLDCNYGIEVEYCLNVNIIGNNIPGTGDYARGIQLVGCETGTVSENKFNNNNYAVYVRETSNLNIFDNTFSEGYTGILLDSSPNNTISGNQLNSSKAIELRNCPLTILENNQLVNNSRGISISESSNCLLRNNTLLGGEYNFGVFGYTLEDFMMDIDTSNTINGKPIYYLVNQSNLIINPSTYPNVGYLGLVNSRNITVEGMLLTNNIIGLVLAQTTDSLITKNTFENNSDSIYLLVQSDRNTISFNQIHRFHTGVRAYYSSETSIIGNSISSGTNAVWLEESTGNKVYGNTLGSSQAIHQVNTSDNTIYHNNFIGKYYGGASGGTNPWNITYPSGGNYWGYNGTDSFFGISQGESGSDGIIDTSSSSFDFYPLVAPIQIFEVNGTNGSKSYVEIESNSTLADIHVAEDGFKFTASGPAETVGFSRITIPKSLIQDIWNNNFTILVNNISQSFMTLEDPQNMYAYVTYPHPDSQITGFPDFSLWAILLLVLAITLFLVVVKRKLHTVKAS